MKQLFTAIFLLWAIVLLAQQETGALHGRVMSGKDTLQQASVMLLKTAFGVSAGKYGEFEIKDIPPGKYQLRITFIGYENFQQEIEIKTGETSIIKAELTPLTSQINEVVVTGNMKEASKLNSVTPIDVYTTQYFQRNPTNNLWDALSFVNGIFPDVDNGVANTSDIQINGIEGNYTETLIDGVPAMNGLAGNYAFTAFPMSIIDKVEVEKGASGTLYGSDAMAGVINIITKNPDNAPTFYTNVELTSYLETSEDLSASFKLKKVSALFSLSGENMNTRWELNPEKDGFMDIPLTNRLNFFNKWNIARKDDRVATVYARYLFEDRFGGQMNATRGDIGSNSTYTQWIRTNQWQAGFKYQLPLKEKVMLLGDYSEHYQNAYFGNLYYTGRQRVLFTQLSWTKKVDKQNELLMGVNYRLKYYIDNTQLSDKYITGNGPTSHIAGAFMEDEISIAEGHKLVLGCRFDYNNRVGPFATPRADYKWNSKDEQNVFRFGLGTGYRVPDLFNDGYGAMAQGLKVVIPVRLTPESDLTLNANYTRVQKLPFGILSLDVSAYYTYFMSYIDPDYSVNGEVIYYNSKNGLDAPGFSGSADFVFQFPLKVGISFYYVDVWEVDTVNGVRVKSWTQHSPHLTTDFYLSYGIPAAGLSLDWTGYVMSPMLLVTENNDYRPATSPWYTIQNIQVTKKFKKGVEIYFGIKNLFNFMQSNPIIRPFDPFNRYVNVNNPNGYVFDTEYGFISNEGIKGFVGFRYTFH
jgi:outer membrane receptor for ferrienterochelin and colicins